MTDKQITGKLGSENRLLRTDYKKLELHIASAYQDNYNIQMPRAKKSATSKSTALKSSTRSAKLQSIAVEPSESSVGRRTSQGFKVKRTYLLAGILVISAIILLYLFRGLFVVGLVNGEPITRLSVISELEKQGGKQVSDSLITQKLILQEARKKNITVSDDEVNKEIKELETVYKEQGQDLNQVLELRGMSRDNLIEQLKVKIILDKLVGKVEVTDEEVQKFIEENNEAYGGTLTEEDVKKELQDQKFSEKSNEFITNLQKNAKIEYFVQY